MRLFSNFSPLKLAQVECVCVCVYKGMEGRLKSFATQKSLFSIRFDRYIRMDYDT